MAYIEHAPLSRTTQASAPRPTRSLFALLDLHRSRRALARLDAERLRDLGITFDDAQAEARRPFWDVPQHWRL